MVVGQLDCCARKDCGHGEIWHPTCCPFKHHRFENPLVIGTKVLLIGDKFYYNFEGDKEYPNDPKGWIQCTFKGNTMSNLIVKPKGFEKFIVSRTSPERFSLEAAQRTE